MSAIFVDTGAWFALFVPTDPDHVAASTWLDSNAAGLITTDYVIDELLTLLRVRNERRRSLDVGDALLSGEYCKLERVTAADFDEAWEFFSRYHDKSWSFTDCVSLAVIRRLRIRVAFAFDKHFREFGTVTVVPSTE